MGNPTHKQFFSYYFFSSSSVVITFLRARHLQRPRHYLEKNQWMKIESCIIDIVQTVKVWNLLFFLILCSFLFLKRLSDHCDIFTSKCVTLINLTSTPWVIEHILIISHKHVPLYQTQLCNELSTLLIILWLLFILTYTNKQSIKA